MDAHPESQEEPARHRGQPKSAPSQHKQRLLNQHSKTAKSPAVRAATEAALGDYRDAAWFQAGEGDLVFAQWLLGRCNGVGDTTAPQSPENCGRMFGLFKTQRKLRLELAMGNRRAEAGGEEEEADEQEQDAEAEQEAADAEQVDLWTVQQIVVQVGDVLRPSRKALQLLQRQAETQNRRFEGGLEKTVVNEVVENATELVLSRATLEHEQLLRRWKEILLEQAEEEVKTVPEVEEAADGEHDSELAATKTKKQERREKKARMKKSKSKSSEEVACQQVESFLVFLKESGQKQAQEHTPDSTSSSDAEKLWTSELQQIVELSSIEPEEEQRRLDVTRDIQTVLCHNISKWRHCEVVLFGSSMSRYGSRSSDLDMCLLPTGRRVGQNLEPPKPVVGARQLRHLMNNKVGEDGHEPSTTAENAEQLRELRAQVHKSIEKLTQSLNTLDRSEKKSDKHAKQRRQLVFFNTQMRLLRNAIIADLTKLVGEEEARNSSSATTKAANLKTVIAASRRRSDDLYLLRTILQRAKCEVRHVIAGARVPIIRFLHTRSGREYECDLCFENVLATRNTLLLRAYASFDGRARALGLAVKHWAKQRGISDAAMGFLSSYSFVLLSIYYLQVVHVLPNLQDPRLLEQAGIAPEYYNEVNIAFCADVIAARSFHKQHTPAIEASEVSLTTLLLGFFEFFATKFDYAKSVVLVRSPETQAAKIAHWGSRKAKTWRMSIQDPLETSRDLGVVLQFKGQEKIICEFRRAHELLLRGASFSEEICEVEVKATVKAGKTADKVDAKTVEKKSKQKQNDGEKKRSYVVILQSDDQELTKLIVEDLFKDFEKSFQIGKVIEMQPEDGADRTECKEKQWQVEVLSRAQQCPRTLVYKTRVDWRAADGRTGRVWIHHQALYTTPPCRTCLSPEHITRRCVLKEEGDAKQDGQTTEKNRRRHLLRVTLGGTHSGALMKKERRNKQQQHCSDAASNHINGCKSKPNTKQSKGSQPSKKEVVAAPSTSTANNENKKKKTWQRRARHKRGESKGDVSNAATA